MAEKTTSTTVANNVTHIDDIIRPAIITDNETGIKYELDFNRDSIRFAEGRDFDLESALKYPVTGLANLFFYSFRKNHRSVPRNKTDELLEKMGGGLPEKLLERLIQLYNQAQTSNTIVLDEDAAKNGKVTLDL